MICRFGRVDLQEGNRTARLSSLNEALRGAQMPAADSYKHYRVQWADDLSPFQFVVRPKVTRSAYPCC